MIDCIIGFEQMDSLLKNLLRYFLWLCQGDTFFFFNQGLTIDVVEDAVVELVAGVVFDPFGV